MSTSSHQSHTRKRPILVVDDDASVLSGIATFLELAGYTTTTARNGTEALEILEAEAPSLILLDLLMPVMDGREFLQSLRQPEFVAWHDIPVVIMSVKEHGGQLTSDLAIAGYLQKPFQPDELLKLIEQFKV